jgi:hypothetical protein
MKHSAQRGFIALTSAIILSAVLLVLVVTLNASSFFNRFNTYDMQNKRVSLGLAEACANKAMLKLAEGDLSGVPGSVVVDATDPKMVCKICELTLSGSIKTRALYNGAYTNLVLSIDPNSSPNTILGWTESALYSGPLCPLP